MTIQLAGGRCTKSEGQDLIESVARLVRSAFDWVSDIQADELSACVVSPWPSPNLLRSQMLDSWIDRKYCKV